METDTKCRSRGDSRPEVVVDARALRKKGESRPLDLDFGLVDEHDRQAIPNRINPMAPPALQALRILAVVQFRFASRANQHFQKFFGQHGLGIIEGTGALEPGLKGRARNRHRAKKETDPAGRIGPNANDPEAGSP